MKLRINAIGTNTTTVVSVLAKIEEKTKVRFKENEVVHTFGDVNTLTLNGLNVPHIEPNDIVSDMRVKVVLFKENLSTGWDCRMVSTALCQSSTKWI